MMTTMSLGLDGGAVEVMVMHAGHADVSCRSGCCLCVCVRDGVGMGWYRAKKKQQRDDEVEKEKGGRRAASACGKPVGLDE